MLRINLLPPYIFDRQKKARTWLLWGGILLAVFIGTGLWYKSANDEYARAQEENQTAKNYKSDYDGLEGKIGEVKTAIAETEKKQTFIKEARAYNRAWPDLFSTMRDLTSSQIILKKMYLASPDTVNMVGWAHTEADAARWWIRLHDYAGPNQMFKTVFFDLPKSGWPPEEDKNAQTAGAPAAGAPGGSPGGFGGGGRPGPIAQTSGLQSGGTGGGGSSGFGGGRPGGGSNSGFGGSASNDKDEEPGIDYVNGSKGIRFNVHAVLNTPFDGGKSVPVWPAAADTSGQTNPGGLNSAGGGAPAGAPASSGGSEAPPSGATSRKRGKGASSSDE